MGVIGLLKSPHPVMADAAPPVPEATTKTERSCDDPLPAVTSTNGSRLTVAVDPSTAWRPPGAEVKLLITGPNEKAFEGLMLEACFRRPEVAGKEHFAAYGAVHILSWNADRTVITIGIKVPALTDPNDKRGWFKAYVIDRIQGFLYRSELVPAVDLRLIGTGGTASDAPLDVLVRIGVTQVIGAFVTTFLIVAWALWMLRRFALQSKTKFSGGNYLLTILATPQGAASLSQFQIMTWTLVVGASAVYVMGLSGNLIDIPNQMLVLLGITGVSIIGAKIKSSQTPQPIVGATAVVTSTTTVESATTQTVADPKRDQGEKQPDHAPPYDDNPQDQDAERPSVAASSATYRRESAHVSLTVEPKRKPAWADLVMDPMTRDNIDVTRVQMFFFTVVSAIFVLLKVFASYTIPELPDGFLWLMGLSNGVYLTNKFVPDAVGKQRQS